MAQFVTVLAAAEADRFNALAWAMMTLLPEGSEPTIRLKSVPHARGVMRVLETDDEVFLARFRAEWASQASGAPL